MPHRLWRHPGQGREEADHREALILETALRWGPDNSWGGNPGTLDHLGAAEFDGQVRDVFHVFLKDPAARDEIEKLAEAEHTIPPAPKPDHAPTVGDRVRVWFSGTGVRLTGVRVGCGVAASASVAPAADLRAVRPASPT